MKKDLRRFLEERETENKRKPNRPLKKGEGEDDQEYIDLMGHYKNVARHELSPAEAKQFIKHAHTLKKFGNVSDNAKTAGAYI